MVNGDPDSALLSCRYDICEELEVIDIPGDHFSILRQDEADMNVIVTALKVKLAPFGWTEQVKRDQKQYSVASVSAVQTASAARQNNAASCNSGDSPGCCGHPSSQAEIQDIDAYLEKMGVKNPALRQRLETRIPFADEQTVSSALTAASQQEPVTALNAAARSAAPTSGHGRLKLVVCCDASGGLGGLEPAFAAMDLPCFALRLPQVAGAASLITHFAAQLRGLVLSADSHVFPHRPHESLVQDEALWDSADLPELAVLATKAVRALLGPGDLAVIGGVGFGAVLAHEVALQLDQATDQVLALALFEAPHAVPDPGTTLAWVADRGQREEVCQVAAALYPTVLRAAGAGGAPSPTAFACKLASTAGYDAQLDYIASFKPPEVGVDVNLIL